MSDPKPSGPVFICHPRRAGKREAVRARIFAMVHTGDLVTTKAGRDAERFKVVMKVSGELVVSLEAAKPYSADLTRDVVPGKVWIVDPANVRAIWEPADGDVLPALDPKRQCQGTIDICVDAGEHNPPCRCVRPSGHGGPHMSGGAW